MSLTLDGYVIAGVDFRDTLDKAEKICERSQIERRARDQGRRESDLEIQALRENLRLAGNLLNRAIDHMESGMHTEMELNTLRLGLEVIRGT
jgi:hypothetical protein